ncbi:hypothetical protein HPB50_010824 [Hyalomma asiaticum]|uniref:Uncharacterized protein n=1 Tax=Hyalomma asiaticum TaxID=266040 RepID=A0ACB7RMZ2_HYAAI|nr:hypothetical protein HPB50_010824 [Hyalomma asiaticum]
MVSDGSCQKPLGLPRSRTPPAGDLSHSGTHRSTESCESGSEQLDHRFGAGCLSRSPEENFKCSFSYSASPALVAYGGVYKTESQE